MMSATIAITAQPTVLHRDTLFTTNAAFGVIEGAYDVTPDGRHFIMLAPANTMPSLNVVLGWADEVREKVAAANSK
jgi:hypothetical protein